MKRHQKYLIDYAKPLAQEQPFPNRYALVLPTVIAISGITGSEQLRTYTLSGEQGKVTWIQLSQTLVWSGFYQPVLPFNQYKWQCQALLEVVAGQTGLPLYDISPPIVGDPW